MPSDSHPARVIKLAVHPQMPIRRMGYSRRKKLDLVPSLLPIIDRWSIRF
jgi:hypothetical protein